MVIFHSYVSSPVGILSIPIISSSYPHDIPMMFPHFFLNSSQKLTACNAQCRRTGASTQRFRRGPTHQGALRVWHLSIQVENRTSMEGAWSFKTIYSTWKNFSQQQFHCNKIMFFLLSFGGFWAEDDSKRTIPDDHWCSTRSEFKLRQRW